MPDVAMSHTGTVVYPESDGERMAENEVQGRQIVRLVQSLTHWFRDRPDVHVGFDLLWYPVEGDPTIRRAPDVFVVPGRPAGPTRPSWLQWREDGVPMRHVIEIISPSNTPTEMVDKRRFYDRYGVEEYLVFHPDPGLLEVHVRTDLGLVPVDPALPWTSSVLEGCAYRVDHGVPVWGEALNDLVLLDPAGVPVETHEASAARADAEASRAEAEAARADAEAARAEALAAKLRKAGLDP